MNIIQQDEWATDNVFWDTERKEKGDTLRGTQRKNLFEYNCLLPVVKHKITLMDKSTPCPCQISNLKEEKELSFLFLLLVHWPSLT